MRSPISVIILLIFLASILPAAHAADFDLSAVIRAGANAGTWDFAVGPSGNAGVNGDSLSPYYGNNFPHSFRLGYTSATNSAYLRLMTRNGQWRQVTYAPGGAGLGAGATWTIPATDLYVTAEGKPVSTGITVSNLALGPGLITINPLSSTLSASQTGSTVTDSASGPTVFQTMGTGDWVVTGLIAFSGLSSYTPGGANGDQLRFGFSAHGTSTPEPTTAAMLGVGLMLLTAGSIRNFRRGAGR
ncbi:MAG: hypothetical protein HY821_01120 [Acidobacteria bacterium]|nr:hypothetical protein [Acidobacteriota bacterium]